MTLEPIRILLIEDNPGDVRLTLEGLKESRVRNIIDVVGDGAEALDFLRKKGKYEGGSRPDLILLDLNLPKISGREVLTEIKNDPNLRRIPVVVLTTSKDEEDILQSYDNHANCYITKPVDFPQFMSAMKQIENFWFTIVKLPPS